MTNYRRWLDVRRKSLCLSCCKPMEHGYCQACWEQQSRAARRITRDDTAATQTNVLRYCRECGQWRDQSAGQCECGTEKR